MRTLKLTHEEIELIEKALSDKYLNTLKFIETSPMLTKDMASELYTTASKGDQLREEIANSEKDV